MSSNDAPKRATAAQLANRKIKAARERKPRVGSPSLGLPQPAANPFSSIDPNVVPTSSFSTGPTNGFTFGQSQSFSQPSTATGESNKGPAPSVSFGGEQNNSSGSFKLFGSQTTSAPSSFDFSSSNSQQVSNPFSNMNSNQGSGFQGFKGNMFNIPGGSQPEKKPDNQPNGGGIFGQASASTNAPMFGGAPTTSAPLFSQSAGPNMFGQNNAPPNIFGAAPTTSPTKGAEAMQMSPDGPKTTGQGIFNVSAPSPPIFKSPFSTASTGFNMGATTATASAPAPAWSFKPTTSTPGQAPTSGSILFGASKPEEPKTATTTTTGAGTSPLFGATSGTPLFGQMPKPAEATQTPASQGTPATSTPKPAGIFGANTSFSAPPAGGSIFGHLSQPKDAAPTTSTANETASIFGHLAQPKPAAAPSPAKEATPLFSAPSTSQAPLFNAPATSAQSTQPPFALFGQTKPAESPKPAMATATSGSQTPSVFTPSTGGSLFQRASEPAKEQKFEQPAAAQAENKSPGEPSPLFASTSTPAPAQPQPMFNSFMNSTNSNTAKPFSPAFGAPAAVAPATVAKAADVPAPAKPKYADASTETVFEVEIPQLDFRPEEEEYPPNATEEVREEFLRAWRLSALNAGFQEEIAQVNCWSQDLDPIIAHYVMLRKMIGHPHPLVTVYTPVPPGSKRPWTPQAPFSEYDEKEKQKRAQLTAKGTNAASPASKPAIPNGDSTASGPSDASHKRKASDTEEQDASSPDKAGKRTKVVENNVADSVESTDETPSKTLSLFANSFVAQKSRGSSADSNEAPGSDESESDEDETTDADQQGDKTTTPSVSPPSSSNGGGGRSLFDRIERDGNGQPVRQIQAEELNEEAKSLASEANALASSVLGGSRTGSPFNPLGSLTPLTGSTNGMGSTRSPSPLDSTKAKASPPPDLPPSGPALFGASSSFTSTPTNGGSMPAPTSNLFGASPSSTSILGKSGAAPAPTSNIFGAPSPTSTPPPTSNIFGAPPSTSAPAVPSSIFATPSSASTPSNNGSLMPPTSNIFGGLKPTSSSTQPGGTSTLSPFPLSGVTSVDPSRATTPAQSDTDNTNDPSDEMEKHAQVDFTRGGPGEEDEDAIFECRSRAYQLTDGNWQVKGVGILRILKHRTNNKSRILLRADPSGSIVLNNHLLPEIDYKQRGNTVQFLAPGESGFQQWMLRVKTEDSAAELKDLMEQHKKKA
ncbi:hypothetical protein FQN49_001362 [Arthroderma sp. PD_2]|nr:hypothetical protein FQN49_001362 [Arthroderma sp. PD_2]